jgi:hypothetical protein
VDPRRPWHFHASSPRRGILMAFKCPHRAELACEPICAAANGGRLSPSQRSSLSASLNLDQHAGGKGPDSHWPKSGVSHRVECLSGRLKQACAVSCSSSSVILSNHTPHRQRRPSNLYKRLSSALHPKGPFLRFRSLCCYRVCAMLATFARNSC